jgi:hypothetical protein
MPPTAILHEIQKLYDVSDRLESLAEQHHLVSEALLTISGSVRNTATLLEVLVATKMALLWVTTSRCLICAPSELFLWGPGPSLWGIQQRCGAEGGVGAASLETCSPRLRHMEEIEATRAALDSRLVSTSKLRCRSFSCLPKIAQF